MHSLELRHPSSSALHISTPVLKVLDSDWCIHHCRPPQFSGPWTQTKLHHQLSWVSILQTAGREIDTFWVGQKDVYSCEYVKHRVYSYIIIYLLLYYFPYKQL